MNLSKISVVNLFSDIVVLISLKVHSRVFEFHGLGFILAVKLISPIIAISLNALLSLVTHALHWRMGRHCSWQTACMNMQINDEAILNGTH